MRIVFRADAGHVEGSGHLMRCITLSEELRSRGHDVRFVGSVDVPWVANHMKDRGLDLVASAAGELDQNLILSAEPDWVVVDSYRIASDSISDLAQRVPVLAIIDGTDREIAASLYLDQNMGAERNYKKDAPVLAGPRFALIRSEILVERQIPRPPLRTPPRVVCFMGGTDPTGAIVDVVARAMQVRQDVELVVIAPQKSHDEIRAMAPPRLDLRDPSPDLPLLLGTADVVVSAAGTSAWDVCTLAIPAVLIGVVDNQSGSLAEVRGEGLALGIDLYMGESIARLTEVLDELLSDEILRTDLSARCSAVFDGEGTVRVAEAMEQFLLRGQGRVDR